VSRLWEKGLPLDQRVLRYTAGEDHRLDARLVAYDVQASIAHARMLNAQGLLADDHCEQICAGLTTLGEQFVAGEWQITLEDEDAHTALETRLTALIGEAGGRVHLGRSRNDQVLVAVRLYLLDACSEVQESTRGLIEELRGLSSRQGDLPIPGYTHMQHAMPSSVALWADGFTEALEDALQGLDASRRRIDQNPLGSAAGYGNPGLPLDRNQTTSALGFAKTQEPVTSVQLSRGKAESGLLFELTLLSSDLSRMASDLLLFYTQEFGYISLADDVTTGSSIMPQKRNPDVLELVRASFATVKACLDESLMITAKLPSGYQRDLQRLKPPLFRGVDLAIESVDVMSCLVSGLRFIEQNIAMDDALNAATEANELVTNEGIPFREAYRRIAAKYTSK
jgi:argininosuccinate lyase